MVNGKPMNHHHDCGADNDFDDPASWNRASYTPDMLAEIGEPLAEKPNDYREASLHFCRIMFCVGEHVLAAPDARVAVVAVAVTLGWPSARDLSISNIAGQLGCSPATLTLFDCSIQDVSRAQFRWHHPRHSARCRIIERRQADFDSSVVDIPQEPRLYRMVKSTHRNHDSDHRFSH
jgi:hypothetical protein